MQQFSSPWQQEDVCAVIVSNGKDDVEQIIQGVIAQSVGISALRIAVISNQNRANELYRFARNAAASQDRQIDIAVIALDGAKNFGDAIRQSMTSESFGHTYEWLWLLHADSLPEADALEELLVAGKKTASIALVGAKQVDWDDPDRVISVGIEATSSAKRLTLPYENEIDQGQYDHREDVLAVGSAGSLVRYEVWNQTRGFDPVLGSFGDSLEYGRRVRRCGYRVVIAPKARVRHKQQSYSRPIQARYRQQRKEQLYNWLLTLQWWAVLPVILFLFPWTLLRAARRVVLRQPHLVLAEFGAYLSLVGAIPALLRGRRRLKRQARIPASALFGLELSAHQYRTIKRERRKVAKKSSPEEQIDQQARQIWQHEKRVSVLSFWILLLITAAVSLLMSRQIWAANGVETWITSQYWNNLPLQWGTLKDQTISGWVASGYGASSPTNPLLLPLLIITAPFSLVGVPPAASVSFLLLFALPLAAIGGWHLGSLFTVKSQWKIVAALLWCAQPSLLEAVRTGNLPVVIFAVSLPWVAVGSWRALGVPLVTKVRGVNDAVTTSHSEPAVWSGIGALGLLFSASVVPALPFMLLVSVLIWIIWGNKRLSLWRCILYLCVLVLPSLISLLPIYSWVLTHRGYAFLGLINAQGQTMHAQKLTWWSTALFSDGSFGLYALCGTGLIATVLAIAATLKSLWRGSYIRLVWLALFLTACSFALVRVTANLTQSSQIVGISALLTLGYLGVVLASLSLAGDSEVGFRRPRITRPINAAVFVVLLAGAFFLPSPGSAETSIGQVPLVARQMQQSKAQGRLAVLTPAGTSNVVEVQVWRGNGIEEVSRSWGEKEGHLSLAGEKAVSALVQTIGGLEASSAKAVQMLCDEAITFILLPSSADNASANTTLKAALDATEGLERIGTTELGTMWRVKPLGQTCGRVYLETAQGRESLDSGTVRAEGEIDLDKPAVLYLAEVADPGWKASIGGQELRPITDPELSQGWRQAFEVPAVKGKLVVAYDPWWLSWWQWSQATVLVVTVLCIIPWRPKRRSWEGNNANSK